MVNDILFLLLMVMHSLGLLFQVFCVPHEKFPVLEKFKRESKYIPVKLKPIRTKYIERIQASFCITVIKKCGEIRKTIAGFVNRKYSAQINRVS